MAITNVNGQSVVPFVGGTRGIVEFLGAGINPSTAAASASGTPGFERILIAQLLSKGSSDLFSITGGDDDILGNALFGGLLAGVGATNNTSVTNSAIFGDALGSALSPNAISGFTNITSLSLQLFSAVNTTQGKRVEAHIPSTGKTVTGTVNTVELSNGRVLVTVNVSGENFVIPAESIQKVFSN